MGRARHYLAYLRDYGGALVVRRDGFVGMHIVKGPGDPIHDDCLVICDLVVPRQVRARVDNTVAVGFGFHTTQPGVYRSIDGGAMELYCATFLAWLDRLIESDGQVDR